MKKRYLFLILLVLFLSGCSQNKYEQIAATTLPVYEFSSILCENTGITVARLITENISCLHDYTVQVSQMRTIEGAQAVVLSGAGLEEDFKDVLRSANRIIDASMDLNLPCDEEHNHKQDSHHHTQDPHIWLSPENAKQMCITICRELSDLYPEHKLQFEQNLVELLAQLDALELYGKTTLQNLKCYDLITVHDSFRYFAESFGLNIIKAVEEESGSEASAMELIELINLVKSKQLPAIFTEVNSSTSAAEVIAYETGVPIYTLNMAIAGNSYFDAMYHNINTIKEALG